jgi:hypothetical protein
VPALDEAQALVERRNAGEALFDRRIVLVNQFPHRY